MEKNITFEQLAAYEKAFDADRANQVAMRAVTTNGVVKAVYRRDRHQYSISLEQGNITNQKQSGRCWMFAALNTMRFAIMKKLDLDTFELSQNYTLFYDKLEKANYFLESILDTLEEPTSGRVIAHLLMAPSTTAASGICSATSSRSTAWCPRTPCPRPPAPPPPGRSTAT